MLHLQIFILVTTTLLSVNGLFVGPDGVGDDNAQCGLEPSSPCASIPHALTLSSEITLLTGFHTLSTSPVVANLTLSSDSGSPVGTVVDCAGNAGFTITDHADVFGVSIINANSSTTHGGAIHLNGTLSSRVENCFFSNCHAALDGGAVHVDSRGPASLIDLEIEDCSAGRDGGGVYINGPNVTVARVTVLGSSAGGSGGGICTLGLLSGVNYIDVTGCTAGASGGGYYSYDEPAVITGDSRVAGNHAGEDGGGVSSAIGVEFDSSTVVVRDNTAGGYGQNVFTPNGTLCEECDLGRCDLTGLASDLTTNCTCDVNVNVEDIGCIGSCTNSAFDDALATCVCGDGFEASSDGLCVAEGSASSALPRFAISAVLCVSTALASLLL